MHKSFDSRSHKLALAQDDKVYVMGMGTLIRG